MKERLSGEELVQLLRRVFSPRPEDRAVAILVDLPDHLRPDTPAWQERRDMAAKWAQLLLQREQELGLTTRLYFYRNVGANNADLPSEAHRHVDGPLPAHADELRAVDAEAMAAVLSSHTLILAPTQFSATAPLKLAARGHGFRAATMPGFSAAMIPALRLDYVEINRRVELMKELLDRSTEARLELELDTGQNLSLRLDLRHRTAHASGGLLPQPGTAGNLPSGETYIVPYEGELPGDPSRSEGLLPVQLGDDVVIYTVRGNRAVSVDPGTGGETARREAELLAREPAYGNMAELGLGVLGDMGLAPTGEILLDEKLGLHIAFGRSDHFGGQVGASDFTSPEAVVHIDRVYLPAMQPRIRVRSVDLLEAQGQRTALIRDDRYVIDFGRR